MLPGGTRIVCMICMMYHMFPGLDLYYADPAQPLPAAGGEPDDVDGDTSARGVKCFITNRLRRAWSSRSIVEVSA